MLDSNARTAISSRHVNPLNARTTISSRHVNPLTYPSRWFALKFIFSFKFKKAVSHYDDVLPLLRIFWFKIYTCIKHAKSRCAYTDCEVNTFPRRTDQWHLSKDHMYTHIAISGNFGERRHETRSHDLWKQHWSP